MAYDKSSKMLSINKVLIDTSVYGKNISVLVALGRMINEVDLTLEQAKQLIANLQDCIKEIEQ